MSRIAELPLDVHYVLLMGEDPMYLETLLVNCPELGKVGRSAIFQRDYAERWINQGVWYWAIFRQTDLIVLQPEYISTLLGPLLKKKYQEYPVQQIKTLQWLAQNCWPTLQAILQTHNPYMHDQMEQWTISFSEMEKHADNLAMSCCALNLPLGGKLVRRLYPEVKYTQYLYYMTLGNKPSTNQKLIRKIQRGINYDRRQLLTIVSYGKNTTIQSFLHSLPD